ncbi:MAG TPA: phosphoenolpyruvate carboxykinase, partial [Tissierellaceae bacterium]|nr:phosphoenolpyruvate carboxykinase [Tissierellaceae bacterium]
MSTTSNYKVEEITKDNPLIDSLRTTIETNFYGNNVTKINSISEAYKLAKESPGTIVTDMSVFRPEELGLSTDSKVLLFNDGAVTGRFAGARVIMGEANVNKTEYTTIA